MLSTIGSKIRTVRELRNLTQENMADILKMSQTGYAKIERNEVEITLKKLTQISEVLGMNVTDLLSFDEKLIFNVSNNQNPVINGINYQQPSIEIELYKSQIQKLEEEVAYLRNLVEKLMK